MRKILVTGASGGVGTRLRRLLPSQYGDIRWSDLKQAENLAPCEEFVAADLADMRQVERITEGVEGIVHLGGYSVEGPWETILQSNIAGTYNLFEAARKNKVKRIVFASSNHVVGFYPRNRKIPVDVTLRPDTRYGVSKAFGESLAALYAYKHGLRVTCLRIGNVAEQPLDIRRLSIWLHPEDLVQLIRIGLEHPDIQYEVFYGASNNRRAWWDNTSAEKFGYKPKHNSEEHLAHAQTEQAKLPADPVGDWYEGGPFCSQEFDGGIEHAQS